MDLVWDIGIAITSFLQSLGGWLEPPMQLFSFLGRAEFYLVFMPGLYWCWDRGLGLSLTFILLISAGLNDTIKSALHQPRPYWIDPLVLALSHEESFGAPSGHAQNAVAVWGYLAACLQRRRAWIAATVLIVLIGLSRLYLGVHFGHDVLMGWGLGSLLLYAWLRWQASVRGWITRQNPSRQVAVAIVASCLLLLLASLCSFGLRDWRLPTQWVQRAMEATGQPIDPTDPKGAFLSAGMLLGLAIGWIWTQTRGGFGPGGPLLKRALRYGLGILGVALIWFGGRLLGAGQTGLLAQGLEYLRAALVGIWTAGGAPEAFVRLGLAERSSGRHAR